MSLLEISAKIKKAIEEVAEKVAEKKSRPSLKTYKAKVTTAPTQVSGTTRYTCGVTLVGDETELTVLCPPRMVSSQVGDIVWVQVLYSNWKNAVLWQKYDFSTARAVSNLRDLSEYCLPFVKKGGSFIAMKAAKAEEEIAQAEKAIKLLGGKIEEKHSFELEDCGERNIILIKKISSTPAKYPRPSAKIAKIPLE